MQKQVQDIQADKQPASRPCIYIKAAHTLKEILARLKFM